MWHGSLAARYWAYTAMVMQRRTERIVRSRVLGAEHYPIGVLRQAQQFFIQIDPVLNEEGLSNEYSDFSFQTMHRIYGGLAVIEPIDCREKLKKYSEFVKTLEQPRSLTEEEIEVAKEVANFFSYLRSAGISDRYQTTIAEDSDNDDS